MKWVHDIVEQKITNQIMYVSKNKHTEMANYQFWQTYSGKRSASTTPWFILFCSLMCFLT